MDMEWSESRREPSIEMDRDDSPMRVHGDGTYDDLEENKTRESSKHRKKDNKNSSRKEEKDHRSKDRERLKLSDKETKDTEKGRVLSRERRKEDRDERDKDRSRDRIREKDYDQREKYKDKEHGHERDKDRKDRGREKDCEREREIEKDGDRGRDKERGKEKNRDRDKEREKERERAKEREREREKEKEKYKDSEKDRDRDIVRAKEKMKGREREADQDTEKLRDKDHVQKKSHGEDYDRNKDEGNDGKYKLDLEDSRDRDLIEQGRNSHHNEDEPSVGGASGGTNSSVPNIMDRISKMKGERLKKKSEDVSEVLAWVNKSRKLEEKRKAEKQKALHLSKIFEEQDNIVQGEEGDEDEYGEPAQHSTYDLAGVKVLHGLDKVIEGGAVVLTLKDQNILADGDVNEEIDMLENVEIGQQKRRDEAYKAAKKKTGVYDDKFNEVPGSEKKMLPQYDDPVAGITLDQRGRFTGEAEKKLEELRRRIHGGSVNRFENLNSVGKTSTDYYTHEEMLQFKKPKKRKSLRKKDKLDIDALEAEALSAGFGVGDLGARNDAKRQAMNEEQARSEAEMRSNAYQLAFAKADEASKSLRLEQTLPIKVEEDENSAFADDEDDLYKSLQRARKLSLKKQEEAISGPDAIARLASTTISETADDPSLQNGESQENKVVFTEMDEFVWGLQLDEEARKPDSEDFFMEEDEAPKVLEEEEKDETGRWTEVQDTENEEHHVKVHKEEIVPDETIHEAPLGKGLSSVLKLLKDRGTLKESVEWGGRNMDKKKSKLVGIADNDGPKEIHIERLDEFGRIMTQKEAFRTISHKFHGKGPGKMKQEKRQKQYYEELKLKKMKNADTPSQSVERMREAQAQLKSPYLVLSGHVRSGQTSDPRNGFGTVKKDLPGGLTPMLGDRKRKADPDSLDTSKAPKNSRGHSFWMGNGGEF